MAMAALAVFAVSCTDKNTEGNFTQYVDPYIGTGGHGHVFMGACVPFGLVQLGPTSIPQTWDWTSGYHISDTTVTGFSHLHLSGTGIGDLSDISFMPVTGDVTLGRGNEADQQSGHWSYFSRANEKSRAGYYATRLDRYGVDVELTATKRVGFHKYTFPTGAADARVVIDLENGTCWDAPVEGYIVQENDTVISGYRYSTGWARNQRIYFTAHFSQPIRKFVVSEGNDRREGGMLKAQRVYGQAWFDVDASKPLYVKVALSPVDIDGARANMKAELPGWDFAGAIGAADCAWNSELGKIKIKTSDAGARKVFYTSLYHTMIAPSEFCDVRGDYRGSDSTIHVGDFVNYTTFSLWDTYRAAHPLMTIIHPEKVDDVINTMIHIYKEQGKLPVWHFMACETDCMVGNPAIPVVADAILKGYKGFDHELAYEAMKTSAMLDERGLAQLKRYGYIPYDSIYESVARCMEYAIADWSLAQVAAKMNKTTDYSYFSQRSKSYAHYFDRKSGFIRGLSTEGKKRTPFNPFESIHEQNDFTEGNAWQYTWLVPHDVDGLVSLFGGRERFIEKLDSLFIVEGYMGDHASPDISGLIGQYAHGNEPSHHVVYMYNMVGQPWKTAELVRRILTTLYHDAPDGLCGNEDVGQMSAWYVLSSMGFYQVEPAGGRYIFGSPLFDEAEINVGGGKTFKIVAVNNSAENKYIQSVKLNGRTYDKNYIAFEDIMNGGKLEFTMGNTHQ